MRDRRIQTVVDLTATLQLRPGTGQSFDTLALTREAHMRFAICEKESGSAKLLNVEHPEKASRLYRGFSFQLKGWARHTRSMFSPH
jgi:hypothetical protein